MAGNLPPQIFQFLYIPGVNNGPVILFDGVCNLCSGAVRFILARDRRGRFRFAALQSDAAKSLLAGAGLPQDATDSIVLLQDGRAWRRSGAALRIARGLDGAWPLLFAFIIVPRPLRDAAYDFVARRRLRWFGRRAACHVPTPELRSRFLASEVSEQAG